LASKSAIVVAFCKVTGSFPTFSCPALRDLALKSSGLDLFSRPLARQLSSALVRFTSVFGMGTGGSKPLKRPKDLKAKAFFVLWPIQKNWISKTCSLKSEEKNRKLIRSIRAR